MDKTELTANDCRNAVALINRAQTTGQEAEEVAILKRKLLTHAQFIEADEERERHLQPVPDADDMKPGGTA